MTLICELFDHRTKSRVYLADCLVSIRNRYDEVDNEFPFHFESNSGVITFGDHLASKVLIGERSFIMGAGYPEKILAIAEDFLRGYNDLADFQKLLDFHYREREIKPESFIYSTMSSEGTVGADSYCIRFSAGPIHFSCGGSGASYIKKLFEGSEPHPKSDILSLAAHSLGELVRREFRDKDFPNYQFGGAYELVISTMEGYRRVPYTIVDLDIKAELAEDGAYDIYHRGMQRAIFSIPFFWGSLFVVMSPGATKDNQIKLTPVVQADLAAEEVKFPKTLEEAFDGFSPVFDMALMRHENVNYSIGSDLVNFEAEGNSLKVKLNEDKLVELE